MSLRSDAADNFSLNSPELKAIVPRITPTPSLSPNYPNSPPYGGRLSKPIEGRSSIIRGNYVLLEQMASSTNVPLQQSVMDTSYPEIEADVTDAAIKHAEILRNDVNGLLQKIDNHASKGEATLDVKKA